MAIVPRAEAAPATSGRRLPVFQGIVPVDRSPVPGDVIAGVNVTDAIGADAYYETVADVISAFRSP